MCSRVFFSPKPLYTVYYLPLMIKLVLGFQTLIKGKSGCNFINVNLPQGIPEYEDINLYVWPRTRQLVTAALAHQVITQNTTGVIK